MKDYDPEQLTENNGQQGRPVLVAVNGKVYDLSQSKRWAGGLHMKRHGAGQDLSDEIKAAPHGPEVLDRFEAVGDFVTPEPQATGGLKEEIDAWLDRHPFFRRHPHPAVVHVPVGLFTVTPVLEALGLLSGSSRTEWAAYCCLAIGLFSIPAAITTGYFTWWINYDAIDSPIIHKKRRLAWTALGLATVAFLVRTLLVTDPLNLHEEWLLAYVAVMAILTGVISIVGFLGGKLTFPYE